MTALQLSIGAVNDIHDAPSDVGRVPAKPIPAGLVSPAAARVVAVGGVAGGLALAVGVGILPAALAVVVLAIGYGYDLLAKGSPWSWLPFALGIPLLPVYGWLGATGTLPPFFGALVPMAVLAGGALAIANARADVEQDLASGTASIATHLGSDRAWLVHAGAWALVIVIAIGWLLGADVAAVRILPVVAIGGLLAGVILAGRVGDPARRERAWQGEAVLGAVALVVWLAMLLA